MQGYVKNVDRLKARRAPQFKGFSIK